MSLISFTPVTDGSTAVAAGVNTPLSTIYNDYNGNLTDANISASAAIAGSKIASGTLPSLKATRIYTAGATWTLPAGLVNNGFVVVEVQGGGGGGGGNASASTNNSGGGGGSGGYAIATILAASLGSSQTVTIGAAGSAGNTNANGGAGGTSSFGSLCVAAGGTGGTGGAAGAGGAGGAGTTGDLLITGQTGGSGSTSVASGASGGDSKYGFGSPSRFDGGATDAATGYGAGGGGGSRIASGGRAGAAGTGGLVIVKEYY